ncbi:LacI family transcriptional regulator [Rhodothermaceae bacterium RA]|nr:LacI family transcriptional regulator [Rhodothermaceae bacterium RA]
MTLSRSKRVTISDVAAEAQVSISTVSLVMNGKTNVSAETRRRVQQAARRLGYVPRKAAQQLAAQKTGNIGFVLREDHFTRSEPFYTRIFLGTEFEARHQNLYVLLATIPQEYEPGTHTPRFLHERNVDGVLVAGKVPPGFLDEVAAQKLPVVLIDYEREALPSVVIDNQGGARAAVSHLIERGHRHIAMVGADLQHPSLKARAEGYRLALDEAGIAYDPARVLDEPGEPRRDTGRRLAARLLALDPPVTAAFCVNDAVAFGVIEAVQAAGRSVPEDLAVVGFDDVDSASTASPPLTTVRVYKEQLGELALRYLADLIGASETAATRYDRGNHTTRLATDLVVRAST